MAPTGLVANWGHLAHASGDGALENVSAGHSARQTIRDMSEHAHTEPNAHALLQAGARPYPGKQLQMAAPTELFELGRHLSGAALCCGQKEPAGQAAAHSGRVSLSCGP